MFFWCVGFQPCFSGYSSLPCILYFYSVRKILERPSIIIKTIHYSFKLFGTCSISESHFGGSGQPTHVWNMHHFLCCLPPLDKLSSSLFPIHIFQPIYSFLKFLWIFTVFARLLEREKYKSQKTYRYHFFHYSGAVVSFMTYPKLFIYAEYVLGLGIVLTVLFVVLLLIVYAMRKRIKLAIALIKEGSR